MPKLTREKTIHNGHTNGTSFALKQKHHDKMDKSFEKVSGPKLK